MDTNRLFEDATHLIRFRNHLINPWTELEMQVFLTRYIESPKMFGRIAEGLPNKTAEDCVLYYYLNKKRIRKNNEHRSEYC